MRDWPSVLAALLRHEDLDAGSAAWAMDQVMSGDATPAQIAGFVVALRSKGETAAEVSGLVDAMLAHAVRVDWDGPALDVVGTGGDKAHTVNISTMAAVVAAAAGAPVIKHGNRAASSQTGTADVLERLGVVIALPPDGVAACVREAGIGFCFAAAYHPAMRHAAVPRRELGVPTVFNVLGPLANPAQPSAALVGCADARLAPIQARVLADRRVHALVVRGEDGLDEVTTYAPTRVRDASRGDGTVVEDVLDPATLGIPAPAPGALRGGEAGENAAVLEAVLGGSTTGRDAAVRDAVVLNAAAALVAYDAATGVAGAADGPVTARVGERLDRARAAIDSGAAADVLRRWVAASSAAAATGVEGP
ncbi:MAG: anthranilate phosphoribosyltransferase [Candidatus Nanopelagicales bacterium]